MTIQGAATVPALDIADLIIGGVPAVRGVSVSAAPGQHLTLVGPSGCGKTTILRAIAGLEQPSSGSIRLFGRTVYDSASGIDVPSERREVSMMFQSYAIWPHMTVFENVAYGLRLRKTAKHETEERVMKALDMVGLADYARREAPHLSGGQQQRVALARSFVFNPKVLLFDEPLSNLDAKLRAQMRVELKELTARIGITSVYVTHDQEEALSLSDIVVVMQDGVIQQQSDPLSAYFRPVNAFVADFMGASNILPARSVAATGGGTVAVEVENGETVVCAAGAVRTPSAVVVKSVHFRLSAVPAPGGVNVWPVTVRRRVFVGDVAEYLLDWKGIALRARELSTHLYDEGQQAFCHVDAAHAVLLP